MIGYWNDAYIAAARAAYPHETAGHELAVGFKLTQPDCTSHNGYYWGLVNGDQDAPQMHHVLPHLWNGENMDPCPSVDGDGFCLVPQGQPVREATSGGARWASAVGHVLVYAADLAVGWDDKKRTPWVIQVDSFSAAEMVQVFGASLNLSGANLSGADLYEADLHGANLHGANLSGANLSGADLYEADLSGANLHGADLHGADLYEADLHGANLYGANLSGADLSGANLSGANLYGANLHGANLSGANLSGANLSRADLYGANLHGANLSGADLYGADLSRANLSRANLSRANRAEYATWPAGFDWRKATVAA